MRVEEEGIDCEKEDEGIYIFEPNVVEGVNFWEGMVAKRWNGLRSDAWWI